MCDYLRIAIACDWWGKGRACVSACQKTIDLSPELDKWPPRLTPTQPQWWNSVDFWWWVSAREARVNFAGKAEPFVWCRNDPSTSFPTVPLLTTIAPNAVMDDLDPTLCDCPPGPPHAVIMYVWPTKLINCSVCDPINFIMNNLWLTSYSVEYPGDRWILYCPIPAYWTQQASRPNFYPPYWLRPSLHIQVLHCSIIRLGISIYDLLSWL